MTARGYILVNTALAELVDEQSMLEVIADLHIGHDGLDVSPHEPLPEGSAYRYRENVMLTAHAAYMTEDAYAELWRRTVVAFELLDY